MVTSPIPLRHPEPAGSFLSSIINLVNALLAARDPGAHARPRIPLARLGESEDSLDRKSSHSPARMEL